MNLISLLILIIILGIIILIHEFGHFLAAKKNGVYVEEFSLGMGPKIWKFKRKNDPTNYSLRLFPVGGFVSMANTEDEIKDVKNDQILENKKYHQKLIVMLIGIIFNFILCIVLLFVNGMIYGSPSNKAIISEVTEGAPAYISGLEAGDKIVKINNHKVKNLNDVLIEFNKKDKEYTFVIERDNSTKSIKVTPTIEKKDGEKVKKFGIVFTSEIKHGFINAVKYSITETISTAKTVFNIVINLFAGKISIKNMSGPVGIYSIVDSVKESGGLQSLIYLTAYLSINVGILNLIPFPVFDGGRVLLITIEKITKKRLNPNIENYLNLIAFILLGIFMVYVTLNDILKVIG
jgi:regulator of sigma E protease